MTPFGVECNSNVICLVEFVKDKKCPFCYFLALKPIVGFSSFVSSLFGGGRGSPPNAPSMAKGLIGVPVGVVVAINFAISTRALSDRLMVILLLSLIATSV